MADSKEVVPVVEPVIDPITAKDGEIAKLKEERDNYKEVALKRLGKLPADSKFLGEEGKEIESIIEEKVKASLLDKEIARKEQEKQSEITRLAKENSELRLALKNRPSAGIGGGGGENLEVKDNVFSEQQLSDLKKRAERLKVKDVNAFIEKAKQNLINHR